MKREYRMYVECDGDLATGDPSLPGYFFLCSRKLAEYFKMPKNWAELTVVLSDSSMKESYKLTRTTPGFPLYTVSISGEVITNRLEMGVDFIYEIEPQFGGEFYIGLEQPS